VKIAHRARLVAVIAVGCGFICGESAPADELSAHALFAWPAFLSHAHSHNDYQQTRPLLDALAAGVSSVEADLYFDRGTIRVAHERGKWRGDFETLYLAPLNARWEANALGKNATGRFLLWLDLKEANPNLRTALETMLRRYPFTRIADPARTRVQVILTGNESAKKAFVAENASPLVTRDSNSFSDADEDGSDQWRWYALDWSKLGTWTGEGAMPPHERGQLRQLVAKIHAKGRQVRLWHHPATLSFWKEASAAGVDLLGTDLLPMTAPTDAPRSGPR
jgi:hypothetical protein